MPRRVLPAALLLAVALLGAREATGHGGQYRAPGGNVPPSLPPPTTGTGSTWWDANLDLLAGEGPVAGPVTSGGPADAERVRKVLRDDRVVPFLRRVVDGALGPDPDLVAAAALALAKTTSEPADVKRILALSDDPARSALLLEAAALAPGLLRRTDPALRFDGRLLDQVRRRCLEVYDGATRAPRRPRALAVLALGLLGDQPGVAADASTPRLDVPAALLSRLKETDDVELEVALVFALGMQARDTVDATALTALRDLATTGASPPRERPPVVHAHALLALARLAGPESSGLLLGFLRTRHLPGEVRQGAIVALGLVGRGLDPVARVAALAEIAEHADRGNPDTVGLALLTLGRLLATAVEDPADRLSLASPPAALLLREIADGAAASRRIACLATGFALRAPSPATTDPLRTVFRERAVAALATAADDGGGDPELRAAALVALGLARDPGSLPRLASLLPRRDVDVALRARAATALGLLGDATAAPLAALRNALAPTSPDGVRREAARSLGLLGDASALPVLVEELRADLPDVVRSRSAVALGALRRAVAVDPLIALASDRAAGDVARAIAVAALGLLADPERVRSLSRFSTDLGSVAVTDALGTALSLL
ncbi:MAG: HEAT repeat domain-containing protein [Planctomycetia bacterium]|nr:HEAT repeat domain-containing protein [Planctomycetia bacterium]